MADKHYDGDHPEEPLEEGHFSEQERKEASRLGDGSPAVEPRESGGPGKSGSETGRGAEGTADRAPEGGAEDPKGRRR